MRRLVIVTLLLLLAAPSEAVVRRYRYEHTEPTFPIVPIPQFFVADLETELATVPGIREGDTAYAKDSDKFFKRTATAWVEVGGGGGGAHNLLSATHTDTTASVVNRGDLIVGSSVPAWDDLAIGSGGTFLRSDGTDPAWTAVGFSDLPTAAQGWTDDGTVVRLTTDSDNVSIGQTTPLTVDGNTPTLTVYDSTADVSTMVIHKESLALSANLDILRRSSGFTALATEDPLGFIRFLGTDGDEEWPTAAVGSAVDGSVSNDIVPSRLGFYTTNTSGTQIERMRITNGGQVSIAAGTPSALTPKLYVRGSAGAVASFPTISAADFIVGENNGNFTVGIVTGAASDGRIRFYGSGDASADGEFRYNRSTRAMTFSTATSAKLQITSAGSVLLAVPGALSTSATDGFTYIPTSAGPPVGVPTTQTGMVPIVFDTTSTSPGSLYVYNGGAWVLVGDGGGGGGGLTHSQVMSRASLTF